MKGKFFSNLARDNAHMIMDVSQTIAYVNRKIDYKNSWK